MSQRRPTLRFHFEPFLVAVLLAVWMPALLSASERGDDTHRKSKNGHSHAEIDGIDVEVTYGRPKAEGREIWGALVPYDKIWRTGADEATVISFSKHVAIEGKNLCGGSYALFTIPGESSWTLVFNRIHEQWGAYGHDPSADALRVQVTPRHGERFQNELEIRLDGNEAVIHWGRLEVPFRISSTH